MPAQPAGVGSHATGGVRHAAPPRRDVRRPCCGSRARSAVGQPGEVLHLQRHARVGASSASWRSQEIPVQRGERAGIVAAALGRVVAAAAAEVAAAHAFEVLAGRRVGLARHQAAVGILAHAERVGQLHPFDGVDVDAQVPGVHLLRPHAEQQRIQARHHQALDVVRVAEAQRLADGVGAGTRMSVSPVQYQAGSVASAPSALRSA